MSKPPIFSIREKVWRYNGRKDTRKGGRLDWNWTGPYEIQQKDDLISVAHMLREMGHDIVSLHVNCTW